MTVAVEGAEDSLELGRQDLIDLNLSENDLVLGIAASGRTPYVIGALDYAKEIGAKRAVFLVILMLKFQNMLNFRLKLTVVQNF